MKKKLEDRGKNLTCETDRKAVAEAGKNKMKTKRKKKEDSVSKASSKKCRMNDDCTNDDFIEEYDGTDDRTELLAALDHKMKKNVPCVLLDIAKEDGDSEFSEEQRQVEKDGGTWTTAKTAIKEGPTIVAKYMVLNKLTQQVGWKTIWKQLKKQMGKTTNVKKKSHTPKTIYVPKISNCKHCGTETWEMGNFKAEGNAKYFAPNGDMHGAKCANCNREIYSKPPTTNNPVYCCLGRAPNQCITCYCGSCYKGKILNADGKKRGNRKPAKAITK